MDRYGFNLTIPPLLMNPWEFFMGHRMDTTAISLGARSRQGPGACDNLTVLTRVTASPLTHPAPWAHSTCQKTTSICLNRWNILKISWIKRS